MYTIPKILIIINGASKVGKDTLIESIDSSFSLRNISSIDKVKKAAGLLWNCDYKSDEYRRFLADLKKLCINYNDLPLKYCIEEVNSFLKSYYSTLMFLHIREETEIIKLLNTLPKDLKVKTLLVTNHKIEASFISDVDKPENFNPEFYDIVFDNDYSTKDIALKKQSEFMDLIKGLFN